MAQNFYKISKGINLGPQASDPSNPSNGDFYYNSTDQVFKFYQNGAWTTLGSGSSFDVNKILVSVAGDVIASGGNVVVSL